MMKRTGPLNEKLLERLFALIPDLISIQDAEMNIIYSNWNGLVAVPEKKRSLHSKCYRTYRDRDDVCPDCLVQTVFQTGKAIKEEMQDAEGNWVDLRILPITGEDGSVEFAVEWIREITARKQTEQERQQSEEKYRALVDQSMAAVFLHDTAGAIFEVNEAAVEQTGFSEEELVEFNVFDLHPPSSPVNQQKNAILKQWKNWSVGESITIEAEHRRKDGTILPVEIRTGKVAVGDEDYILALTTDITERKKLEQALNHKNKEQQMLLDNIETQIWYLYDVETYGAVNQAHADFFHVETKALQNKNLYDIMATQEEAETCIAGNKDVFTKKRKLYTEEWCTNGEGEKRLLSITKTPKLDDNNNVEYVICSATDITEFRHAQEESEESRNLLDSVFQSIQDGISVLNTDLTIRKTNQKMEEWYDHAVPFVGEKCYEIYQNRSEPCVPCPSIKAIENVTVCSEEVPYKKGDKQAGWLELYCYPLLNQSTGTVEGIIEFVRDITERKQAEETIRKNEEELQEAHEIAKLGRWDFYHENNQLRWSETIFAIFEVDPEEFDVSYEGFLARIHPDDRARVDQAWKRSLENKKDYQLEHRLLMDDDRVKWVKEQCRTEFDDNGRPVHSTGIVQDITELREVQDRYRLLYNTMNQGVIYQDNEGNITSCNPAAERILGLTADQIRGKTAMDPRWRMIDEDGKSIPGEDHPAMIALRTRKKVGPVVRGVYHPEEDRYVWLSISAIPLFAADDENPSEVYATIEDITKRRDAQKAVQAAKERLELVMDNLPIGIAVNSVDPKVNFKYMNDNFCKIYDVRREELEKRDNFWKAVYENATFREEIKKEVLSDVASGDVERMVWEDVPIEKEGQPTRYISAYNTPLPEADLFVSAVIDVTDRKRKEKEIRHISNHDYLTGIPNRRYYQEALTRYDNALHYPLGIIIMDMNGLKLINDAYGYEAGNQALRMTARVLKKIQGSKDFIARIGGDEFAMVCSNTNADEMDERVASIEKEMTLQKVRDIPLSLALGYDIKHDKKRNIRTILVRAENNMHKNKVLIGESVRTDTILSILEALQTKFTEEKVHSERVSHICKLIGEAMDLRSHEILELEKAGLYHDIGKISVPDALLEKPGKLTSREWKKMKEHTLHGYQILRAADRYSGIAEYAMSHHERMDGKGYPNRVKGKEIPLFSRIIAVADAYEAMTSDRPYRKALTEEEALAELKKHAGTQFDADVVDVFIERVYSRESL